MSISWSGRSSVQRAQLSAPKGAASLFPYNIKGVAEDSSAAHFLYMNTTGTVHLSSFFKIYENYLKSEKLFDWRNRIVEEI